MAYIYANLIFNGKKTIDQVPKNLLEEIKTILNKMENPDAKGVA